jgi:hypothetical protein
MEPPRAVVPGKIRMPLSSPIADAWLQLTWQPFRGRFRPSPHRAFAPGARDWEERMRRMIGITLLALLTTGWDATAQPADFSWNGAIAPGKSIEIKGVNGAVRAELASGSQVEVTAQKRGRRSDPATVSVQVVQADGNVTICAVYPTPANRPGRRNRSDGPNECRPGEGGRMNTDDNDVSVEFTVRVPVGVRFVGRTVNGTIEARSLQSDAQVSSVNGRVSVTTTGLARAETVNGAIDVTMGSGVWTEPLEFRTVNGSIDIRMPPGIDANVHADTLNGRFTSDFPVAVTSSRGRGRRITGTIGNGGRELELHTVNGSIRLIASTAP